MMIVLEVEVYYYSESHHGIIQLDEVFSIYWINFYLEYLHRTMLGYLINLWKLKAWCTSNVIKLNYCVVKSAHSMKRTEIINKKVEWLSCWRIISHVKYGNVLSQVTCNFSVWQVKYLHILLILNFRSKAIETVKLQLFYNSKACEWFA